MATNTKRFFQIGESLLMEYEMNDIYTSSRNDKYGEYLVGDCVPVLMKLKNGSKLFTFTKDSEELKHNNLYKNISLNYDENNSMYFHFDGGDITIEDYAQMNAKFGVDEPIKEYVSVSMADSIYDERIQKFYSKFDNVIKEYESEFNVSLTPFDVEIIECLKYDEMIRLSLLNLIKKNHTDDYIFRYYDDNGTEYFLKYDECFANLIDKGLDYYKNTEYEQVVDYSLATELWAFKSKSHCSYSVDGSEYSIKFKSLDYASTEIKKRLTEEYAIVDDNIEIVGTSEKIPFDMCRIYFVGGYFVNDLYGFHLILSSISQRGEKIILADVLYNKESNLKFEYLDTPLYISNRMYDKYIEIKVPAIKYMSTPLGRGETVNDNDATIVLGRDLDIADFAPIKVEYRVIGKQNVYDYRTIDTSEVDILKLYKNTPEIPEGTDAILYNPSSVATTLFPQTANSDRLGAYVSIPEGKNYVEFGGTWDFDPEHPMPITWKEISQFNVNFRMYDIKNLKDKDYYTPGDSFNGMDRWVGYHELVAKFYKAGGSELDSTDRPEPFKVTRYNFTQMFGVEMMIMRFRNSDRLLNAKKRHMVSYLIIRSG